jgi:hypothetical protein
MLNHIIKYIVILLFFIIIFLLLSIKINKNPEMVKLKRSENEINYEKAIIVRDYYKYKFEKIKEIKGLVANKDYLELEMLCKISELDVEIAELKITQP